MLKNKGRKAALLFEYVIVFAGFLLMYLFIYPQVDVFPFARATDGSLQSVLEYSLNYGNGRLLGNIIGVFFSYHFQWAALIIAAFLAVITVLMNHIFAGGSIYTVFPLALFIAVPSAGIVREGYYLFASFCNYVIPAAGVLLACLILKTLKEKRQQNIFLETVLYLLLILISAGTCLFSENTTIVILFSAVLLIVYNLIQDKKISVSSAVYFLSVAAGALIMFLIPYIMESSQNIAGYRGIASGIAELVSFIGAGYFEFSEIFSHFFLMTIVLSAAMIFAWRKQSRGSRLVNHIQLAILSVYPFWCMILALFDSSIVIQRLNFINVVITTLYALSVFYTSFMIDDKKFRIQALMFCILTFVSIAPMLIVNQNGYRTYYTTFIIVSAFAFLMVKHFHPEKNCLDKLMLNVKKVSALSAFVIFISVSVLLFMQSVYNYDCYVMRSEYIARNAHTGDKIEIPLLPCNAISIENAWPKIGFAVLDLDEEVKVVVDINSWEYSDKFYTEIIDKPFITAVIYAEEHYEFKNPLYPKQLCG